MVVLGTTIHEFACTIETRPSKLVGGRTKSDHDGVWKDDRESVGYFTLASAALASMSSVVALAPVAAAAAK